MPITIHHTTPPASLAQYVERFWRLSSDTKTTLRIIPDGCWDIVINAGGPIEFVGPMAEAFLLPLEPDAKHYGVRFKPGTYPVMLQKDLSRLVNQAIPLDMSLQRASNTEPLQYLEVVVSLYVKRRLLLQDKTVQEIVEQLSLPDPKSLEILCKQAGISIATIERKFKKYVGLTPRQFRRIRRQLAVNAELMTQSFPQLGTLAADFGYVDQAHMTHELRLLSGATPSNLHKEYDDYVQYNDTKRADTNTHTNS